MPAFEVATVTNSSSSQNVQYAIRKSHASTDGGDQQQRIVAELDSSLNQWADSVPAHRVYHPLSSHLARVTVSHPAPHSQMGRAPRRRGVPAPVREPPRVLLPSAGVRAPRIHPPVPRVSALLPVADHLHERGSGVHSAPRRALRTHRDACLPEPGAHSCLVSMRIEAGILTRVWDLGYTEPVRPGLVLQAVGEQAGRKRARGGSGPGICAQVPGPDQGSSERVRLRCACTFPPVQADIRPASQDAGRSRLVVRFL